MRQLKFLLVGGFLFSGCFVVRQDFVPVNPMFDQGGDWYADSEYATNGEQIYYAAINDRGQRIRFSGGQNFRGMMMGRGNNLACASCHGADGRGGVHTMHMNVMDAPDIRYGALSGEYDAHGGESHQDEHEGYGVDDFRLAVVGGVHPDGESLSRDMPRWLMMDQDLKDLFEY
jgi:hypothetical protein